MNRIMHQEYHLCDSSLLDGNPCGDVRAIRPTQSEGAPFAKAKRPVGALAFCLLRGAGRHWPRAHSCSVEPEFLSALILLPTLLRGSPQNLASPDAAVLCTAAPPQHENTPLRRREFVFVLRGRDLHPRPPGYEPGELLLLHPAIAPYSTTK